MVFKSVNDRMAEVKAQIDVAERKVDELNWIKKDLQEDIDELEIRRRELVIEIQQMIFHKG